MSENAVLPKASEHARVAASQAKPKSPAGAGGIRPAARNRLGLVPALENAIAVINYLNETPQHAASLAELHTRLGITKSHCHSILKTLVHAGWLRFDDRTKSYGLYSGLVASASSLLSSPILNRIREQLSHLVQKTGCSCVLTQPQADDTFVVIENYAASRSMEVSHPIGFHFPKDAPAQMRAYMAWQPEERLERWLRDWKPTRYTAATIVTPSALKDEIAASRARGYSRSVGEHFEGMTAFGLPIFDRDGDVMFVFCVLDLIPSLAPREEEIAQAMHTTCRAIHQSILGMPPVNFPV